MKLVFFWLSIIYIYFFHHSDMFSLFLFKTIFSLIDYELPTSVKDQTANIHWIIEKARDL